MLKKRNVNGIFIRFIYIDNFNKKITQNIFYNSYVI